MKQKKLLYVLVLIIVLILSCNLGTNIPSEGDTGESTIDPQVLIDQAVAETMAAQTQITGSVQETVAAMGSNPLQITETPMIPVGSEIRKINVSLETNCRSGPGPAYEILGVLFVGEDAEVVGRSAASDNWVIKLPSNPSITCWLWGQYATVNGDTSSLPVVAPPPTPTPTITQVQPPPSTSNTLTIINNGVTTVFYVYISLSTNASWGEDKLGASTISAGASHTWTITSGTYDVKIEDSSHNVLKTWFAININGTITLVYP